MVTRASMHSLDAFTVIGDRSRASARSRLPQQRSIDDELAPLGIPALALGMMLIGTGLAFLPLMREWAGNYGPLMVCTAYILYLSLAIALSMWGVRRIRDHRRFVSRASDAAQSALNRR
ncbi:hypothetical protein [Nocardia sp. NBC_01009]|uniref:hypothetical protein n=1 Tax=Nocardia sp. NBC_01009 TaxID=2975996 RepID=UPI0038646A61|nr:hypothetical protein OHA42_27595 [Nocardia sp. NBC_01009]